MAWGRLTAGVVAALAVVLSIAPASAGNLEPRLPGSIPGLRPEVLELALRAFRAADARGLVERARLTVVDYELPSYLRRLWVIDLATGTLLHHEWVAHGMGSPQGAGGDLVRVLAFSNRDDTRMSSLGLYRTGETYVGRHGRSLRLDGLETGFNDAARRRAIVVHGADYVSRQQALLRRMGRSWGCPAVRPEVAQQLIDAISGGSLLWVYYPEPEWLAASGFLGEDGRDDVPTRLTAAAGPGGDAAPAGR